jgi:hypothetical protein
MPDWKDLYRAALVEWNPRKLKARVQETEAAIAARLQHLPTDCDAESLEIRDALSALRILKQETIAGGVHIAYAPRSSAE